MVIELPLSICGLYAVRCGCGVVGAVSRRGETSVIDIDRMRIDPAKLDTVAWLGGNTCSLIRDRFEMPTLTWPSSRQAGLAMPEK